MLSVRCIRTYSASSRRPQRLVGGRSLAINACDRHMGIAEICASREIVTRTIPHAIPTKIKHMVNIKTRVVRALAGCQSVVIMIFSPPVCQRIGRCWKGGAHLESLPI